MHLYTTGVLLGVVFKWFSTKLCLIHKVVIMLFVIQAISLPSLAFLDAYFRKVTQVVLCQQFLIGLYISVIMMS